MKSMHPWEKTYKEKKFSISTDTPSVIIEQNKNIFRKEDKILDIGCGNGRNAIFLANLGCFVDAIDVADLGWFNLLPQELKEKVRFNKGDILQENLSKSFYNVVIAARLIQYIEPESLGKLFKNIYESLKEGGFFLLSYNRKGGIHNKEDIQVPKFGHDVDLIKNLLKKFFKKVEISKGSSISMHVGYAGSIESYDVKCLK